MSVPLGMPPSERVGTRSPLFGILVAGMVSLPVWAVVAVAVSYIS